MLKAFANAAQSKELSDSNVNSKRSSKPNSVAKDRIVSPDSCNKKGSAPYRK